MSATAAHLVDNVLPRVPYRQWVVSLPKRIRYFALHDSRHAAALLRIFLEIIETTLRKATPQASKRACIAAAATIAMNSNLFPVRKLRLEPSLCS